jgi:hypothetical protein
MTPDVSFGPILVVAAIAIAILLDESSYLQLEPQLDTSTT